MGQGRWRTGMMAAWVGLAAGAAALVAGGAMLGANSPAAADKSVQFDPLEAYTPLDAVNRATSDMASPVLRPGADPSQAWMRPAAGVQRTATPTQLYDNGMTL